MQIKKGTWRIAILLPKLGIAIKLPRIYLRNGLHTIYIKMKCRRRWFMLRKEIFDYSVYVYSCAKQWLLRGIYENFSERKFYRKTRHPFLLPTYFSLLGFLNIQKLGLEPKIDFRDLWYQIATITDSKAFGHHYTATCNFSYLNNKLQILDYGDPRVQKVVEEFGGLLQEKFDLNVVSPYKKD